MSEKDTPVKFIVTDAYDPEFSSFEQEIGKISHTDLEWLMSELSNEQNTVKPNSCVRTMSIQHLDTVNFGMNPFHNKRNQSVEISNIFYFTDTKPKCTSVPRGADEDTKMNICYKNLAEGKCCDEFIRRTLGATLFPQHYAKDKQK
ncbi:MAG: hypothetical protein II208_03590 [Alphaproteobacteria bacterium]|nr:hypothetical protein [Alphaproteobacteria bacterium]